MLQHDHNSPYLKILSRKFDALLEILPNDIPRKSDSLLEIFPYDIPRKTDALY